MANTTNLNLAKPAGTDKALVSVLNSNSDKIDAWAGTTNQALSNKFANLGTLSASTETDFFTAVVNQIKTYANGTYVFSATWQSNSAYIITASKVSNTRIIGSAVPQMQNGKDMVGFSYEGTTLNLYPVALKSDVLFKVGDTFALNAAQMNFRTLSNKTEIYFVYYLPKECASEVNSFTVSVISNSPTWFSGGDIGAVSQGAQAHNIALRNRKVLVFSLPVTGTIQDAGFGICELAANITFTA